MMQNNSIVDNPQIVPAHQTKSIAHGSNIIGLSAFLNIVFVLFLIAAGIYLARIRVSQADPAVVKNIRPPRPGLIHCVKKFINYRTDWRITGKGERYSSQGD